MFNKECIYCGKQFKKVGRSKVCADCWIKHHQESVRKRTERYYKNKHDDKEYDSRCITMIMKRRQSD